MGEEPSWYTRLLRRLAQETTVVIPTDGMTITSDIALQEGVYYLPHGLTIAADPLACGLSRRI